VDEVNHNGKPKRTRVLRATDVIPPFDKIVPPSNSDANEVEQPSIPPCEAGDKEDRAEGCFVPLDTGSMAVPLADDEVDIPSYDLAENILAEQRRAAGKRRRAPGPMADEPMTPAAGAGMKISCPDLGAQDLLELQRIVAEIVARDIERLCRRPDRLPFAVYP